MSRIVTIISCLCGVCSIAAADEIRFQRDGEQVFVHAADVAGKLSLKLEIVHPGKLLTFCTLGDDAICIPVRLTEQNHREENDSVWLLTDVIQSSLKAEVRLSGETVIVTKSSLPLEQAAADVAAYNADWGEGRGFRRGQTVPDIPFVDLEGKEVRFSQFLGQRYILYCWASW